MSKYLTINSTWQVLSEVTLGHSSTPSVELEINVSSGILP